MGKYKGNVFSKTHFIQCANSFISVTLRGRFVRIRKFIGGEKSQKTKMKLNKNQYK